MSTSCGHDAPLELLLKLDIGPVMQSCCLLAEAYGCPSLVWGIGD